MNKVSLDDLQKIVLDCKKMNIDLRMSDIFYAFGLQRFESKEVVFTVLFGKEHTQEEVEKYDKSQKIRFLKKYVSTNFPLGASVEMNASLQGSKKKRSKGNGDEYADITFEENKEALIKLLEKNQRLAKEGKIEEKDAIKIESDIRLKLNNYFNVSEKQDEQRIQVLTKFNTVCPHTRKECWVQTKEFAMQHWGLVDGINKGNELVNKDNEDER